LFSKYLDNLNKITIFSIFLIITGSIFIGFYIVFFTNIGKDVSWISNVPLNFLILNIFGISNLNYVLGITFILFWTGYIVFYSVIIFKPFFFFKGFFKRQMLKHNYKDFDLFPLNYLYIVIQWFSAYFIISILIDIIQQSFGIQIGTPLMDNPLLSFLYLTAAPINEEILFRVILIGIPLSLIVFKYKNSLISSLIYPSKNLIIRSNRDRNILIVIILLNSIFFGFSHVIFGGNYEVGKIAQATLGGLFLGWLYYQYGVVSSIIFHWISNYVIFSYGLMGSIIFKISWNEETGNYLLFFLYVIFIIAGIIFIFHNFQKIISYLKRNKKI
jgi:membrane protease YdiL (CAAX protease family)